MTRQNDSFHEISSLLLLAFVLAFYKFNFAMVLICSRKICYSICLIFPFYLPVYILIIIHIIIIRFEKFRRFTVQLRNIQPKNGCNLAKSQAMEETEVESNNNIYLIYILLQILCSQLACKPLVIVSYDNKTQRNAKQ